MKRLADRMGRSLLPLLVFLTVIFTNVLPLCAGVNQWTPIGPYGGDMRATAFSPNFSQDATVFAGAYRGGLFKSTDGGSSWSLTGLTDDTITALAVSPNYATDKMIFAGTEYGAYKSIDGGATWSSIGPATETIKFIAISPDFATDNTIFLGSSAYGGMYKSTNGGATWSIINSGFISQYVYVRSVAISPNFSSDYTLLLATDLGFYKSTNAGATWSRIYPSPDYIYGVAFSPDYLNDHTAYAFNGTEVYKSTDNGVNWTVAGTGIGAGINCIAISPGFATDKTIYAGTSQGLYKTTNGGQTWSSAGTGIAYAKVQAVSISPDFGNDTTVVAGTFGDLYKSSDAGAIWNPCSFGINGLAISATSISSSNVIFAGSGRGDGIGSIYKSTAGGPWTLANNNGSNQDIMAMMVSPAYDTDQTVFAGTVGNGLLKTTDGGVTWTRLTGLNYNRIDAIAVSPAFTVDHTLFASTYGSGIFKSTDGGNTWSPANAGNTELYNWKLVISPNYASDQTLFAVNNKGLYKTRDGGLNWSLATSMYCDGAAISPNYANDFTLYISGNVDPYKSTDGGTTWTEIRNGYLFIGANTLAVSPDYARDKIIYAGNNNGLYRDKNDSDTWSTISGGLSSLRVDNLAFAPLSAGAQTVYAGNFDGLYQMTMVPVPAAAPTTASFNNVYVTLTSTKTVTLSNSGELDLIVSGMAVAGTDAGSFGVTPGTCGSLAPTIPAGGSCTINVTFSPASEGARSAQLQVSHNGSQNPLAVALTGTGVYDTTPPKTYISPAAGRYGGSINVTLSLNEAGTVFYTLDGSDPVTSPTTKTYSQALTIAADTTVKYYGQDLVGNKESVKTATFVIDTVAPITTASPASGSFNAQQVVTLTSNEPATIYYTLDGTTPTTASPVYYGPFTVYATTTVKFFAKDLVGNTETPKFATYTLDTIPPVTTPSSTGGTYPGPLDLYLQVNDYQATIYYTTDGSEPTTASSVYSTPIRISATTTVKFFARDPAGNSEATHTETYTIEPSTVTWLTKAPLLTGLSRAFSAVSNNNIFILGGSPNGAPVTSGVWKYDPAMDMWSTSPPLTAPRFGGATVAQGTTIYLVGGMDANMVNLSTVTAYDTITGTSTDIGNLLTPRSRMNGTILNNKIYVVGGTGAENTLEEFDLSTRTSRIAGTLPEPTQQAGITSYQGWLYIVGAGTDNTKTWSFDPATSTFYTYHAPLPNSANARNIVVDNDRIYMVDAWGYNNVNFVYEYNIVANIWNRVANVPTLRNVPMVEAVNGTIYVMGGDQASGKVNEAWQYGSSWSVYSVYNNGGSLIDWQASQHAPLPAGSHIQINSTLYYVNNSGTMSWSGANYNWADLYDCDQFTGRPFGPAYLSAVAGQAIVYETLPPMTIASPSGGTYFSPIYITLSADKPATIYYTIDGSTPTTASAVFGGSIYLDHPAQIRFFARDAEGRVETSVKEEYYYVGKYDQSITFPPIPVKTYGDATFSLTATASSGLPVTYTSSNTAVATINGSTVTIVGAGDTVITALQEGDSYYNPAQDMVQTMTVQKATTAVGFGVVAPNPSTYGQGVSISATITPAGATGKVEFSNGTGWSQQADVNPATGNAVVSTTTIPAGINSISAQYLGDGNHAPSAPTAGPTQIVNKANQTITFSEIPTKVVGNADFVLTATASSGLPVTYTSSNTAVARVSGNTVTIVGPGSADIIASQWGDSNYNSASSVSRTLTVIPAEQAIKLGDNGQDSYFPTLTAAYNAITSGTDAQMQLPAMTLAESLVFDKDYIVTLIGGYESSSGTTTGVTTILGSMTVEKGTITIDGSIALK